MKPWGILFVCIWPAGNLKKVWRFQFWRKMTCCLKTCLCLSLSLCPCWPTWCWSSLSWPTWTSAGTDTTPCHKAAPGPPPCNTLTSPRPHSQPSLPVYPKLWRYKSGSGSSNPDRPDTIKLKTLTNNPILFVFYPVQVLDLSNNDLKNFSQALPALRELHLTGNKFLRLPSGSLFPNLQTLTIQVRMN